jgi:hypothetical protein
MKKLFFILSIFCICTFLGCKSLDQALNQPERDKQNVIKICKKEFKGVIGINWSVTVVDIIIIDCYLRPGEMKTIRISLEELRKGEIEK